MYWTLTRLARRMPLVEHLSLPPVFSGVCVIWSLILCVCFVDVVCTFTFGHCVVCSSSIYEFLLPLWYLQTLFLKSIYYILSTSSGCKWQKAMICYHFKATHATIVQLYIPRTHVTQFKRDVALWWRYVPLLLIHIYRRFKR